MTLQELQQVEARYRRASTGFEEARVERGRAVREALASGWTHARVADALGVSRGRVGQIAQGR